MSSSSERKRWYLPIEKPPEGWRPLGVVAGAGDGPLIAVLGQPVAAPPDLSPEARAVLDHIRDGHAYTTILEVAARYAATLTPPDPLEEAREALREIAACAPNPSPTLRWAHSALAALDRMKKDPAA